MRRSSNWRRSERADGGEASVGGQGASCEVVMARLGHDGRRMDDGAERTERMVELEDEANRRRKGIGGGVSSRECGRDDCGKGVGRMD